MHQTTNFRRTQLISCISTQVLHLTLSKLSTSSLAWPVHPLQNVECTCIKTSHPYVLAWLKRTAAVLATAQGVCNAACHSAQPLMSKVLSTRTSAATRPEM